MEYQEAADNFKNYLIGRNYSDRTIDTYLSYTNMFFSFMKKNYARIKSFEKVTKNVIRDYQNYLMNYTDKAGNALSNKTQNLKLISVKQFFQFLKQNDLILKNPTDDIVFAKEEDKIIRNILTVDETFKLINNIKLKNPVSIRNRAIIETVYSCGIRTSELCRLLINDVDLKMQTVTIVKGKGGKSRICPLTQYATEYIDLYLKKGRKYMLKGKKHDPGFLFLTKYGNAFTKNTINRTVIESVTRNLGLKKHISMYSFRHGLATQLIASDVDITYVAKLLGHKNLRTTQKYTRIEISDLKKVHSLYHPREAKQNREINPVN